MLPYPISEYSFYSNNGFYPDSDLNWIDLEFTKLEKTLNPDESIYNQAKEVFEAYSIDNEFRDIVDSKKYHDGAFSIKISSRELVKLTFQNLHPFHAPSFWEKNNLTNTISVSRLIIKPEALNHFIDFQGTVKSDKNIHEAISQSEHVQNVKGEVVNCVSMAPEFHRKNNSCTTGRGACGSD